jgi:lysozyme family protein
MDNIKKYTRKTAADGATTESYEFHVPPMQNIPQPVEGDVTYGNPQEHPGEPRGVDNIPAWLSEGEFVVNPQAVEMYGPEIEAMNNHGRIVQAAQGGLIPPMYKAEGGKLDLSGISNIVEQIIGYFGGGQEEPEMVRQQLPLPERSVPPIKQSVPQPTREAMSVPQEQAMPPQDIPENTTRMDIINKTLGHEGGKVNDPDDKGGKTNYGITQSTYNMFGGDEDVYNLTRDQAKDFYNKYYDHFGIDKFPEENRDLIFDMYTNHSPRGVAKILQKAAGVKADGIIGPKTLAALKNTDRTAIVSARNDYYDQLVANNPSQSKFLKGWKNRSNSYLPKYKAKGGIITKSSGPSNVDYDMFVKDMVELDIMDKLKYGGAPALAAGVVGDSMDRSSYLIDNGKLYNPMDRFGDEALYGDRLTRKETRTLEVPEYNPLSSGEPVDYGSDIPRPLGNEDEIPWHFTKDEEQTPNLEVIGINPKEAIPPLITNNFVTNPIPKGVPTNVDISDIPEGFTDITQSQKDIDNQEFIKADLNNPITKVDGAPEMFSTTGGPKSTTVKGSDENATILEEVKVEGSKSKPKAPKPISPWWNDDELNESEIEAQLEYSFNNTNVQVKDEDKRSAWQDVTGFLKEWGLGDFIDKQQVGKLAGLYLGSRLLGYDSNDSLQFSSKVYLKSIGDKQTMKNKLITDGKYKPASVKEAMDNNDISLLKLKGGAFEPTGESKFVRVNQGTSLAPKWTNVKVQKVKIGKGTYFIDKNGTRVDMTSTKIQEFDPALHDPKSKAYVDLDDRAHRSTTDSLKEVYDMYGTIGKDDKKISAPLTPNAAARDFVQWARSNNMNPLDASVAAMRENAYRSYLASWKDQRMNGGKTKVNLTEFRPYLEQQQILMETGTRDLMSTGTDEDGIKSYVRPDKVNSLRRSIIEKSKDSKVPSTVAVKQAYSQALKDWSSMSDEQKRMYQSMASDEDLEITPFFAYMESKYK